MPVTDQFLLISSSTTSFLVSSSPSIFCTHALDSARHDNLVLVIPALFPLSFCLHAVAELPTKRCTRRNSAEQSLSLSGTPKQSRSKQSTDRGFRGSRACRVGYLRRTATTRGTAKFLQRCLCARRVPGIVGRRGHHCLPCPNLDNPCMRSRTEFSHEDRRPMATPRCVQL